MARKQTPRFRLKLKRSKIGSWTQWTVLNQYNKPATRPFINKSSALKYIRDSYKK